MKNLIGKYRNWKRRRAFQKSTKNHASHYHRPHSDRCNVCDLHHSKWRERKCNVMTAFYRGGLMSSFE